MNLLQKNNKLKKTRKNERIRDIENENYKLKQYLKETYEKFVADNKNNLQADRIKVIIKIKKLKKEIEGIKASALMLRS